jgi:hypothetical protein
MKPLLACAILIAMTASASAECLQWGRTLLGNERGCILDGAVNYPIISEPMPMLPSLGIGTTTITSIPSCPKDREPVMRSNGHYGCALNVTEPRQ